METLSILLAALLALCVMPSALAIKCYECTNIPGYSSSVCGDDTSKLNSITCGLGFDRCMTITGTITIQGAGSMDIELRNCSNSIVCNPDSPFGMCNILNSTTGLMSKCNTDCCEGDLCNGAVRTSAFIASFAAVLLALFLNL
ncbi:hypothetical protein ACROYT_G034359 [Oculina patagonica]